jgi:hypothetical protein
MAQDCFTISVNQRQWAAAKALLLKLNPHTEHVQYIKRVKRHFVLLAE